MMNLSITSTYLTCSRTSFSFLVRSSTQSTRSYASQKSTDGPKKKTRDVIQDPRVEKMKSMMFDPAFLSQKPLVPRRHLPPVSAPPVFPYTTQETFDGKISHRVHTVEELKRDTVERAWYIMKQKEAVQVSNQLKAQYKSMRKAMELLEKVDSRLFKGATEKQWNQRFPTNYRIPTETPPLKGWDYDMKSSSQ